MSLNDESNTTLSLNMRQVEEARMRVTLGLTSDANASRPTEHSRLSPGRHGDKTVALVKAPRQFLPPDPSNARLATLASELKAERSERVAAQQALSDAQRMIQQLQTKLAHAEIAAAEAFATEQKARFEAEARLRDIPPATPPAVRVESAAEPKKRGRPLGKRQVAEEPKPQPVKWWLPSYKASRAKPSRLKR